MNAYDVLVIGAGPGGYVAAIRAAQHGLKTALIEKDKQLGGTCLLRGCIPTKSLLHTADLLELCSHSASAGVQIKGHKLDMAAAHKAKQQIVEKSASGIVYLMKHNQVTVIHGEARLRDPHHVDVYEGSNLQQTLEAKNIILATGSAVKYTPGLPQDNKLILTSDDMLQYQEVPKRLLVIGGGAVGVEFASMFSRFGSEVHLLELQKQILPTEDNTIAVEFAKILRKKSIRIATSSKIHSIQSHAKTLKIDIETPQGIESLEVEALLSATGRMPVTAGLQLEKAGITTDAAGYIAVDGFMRSQQPHIYAIGDIVRTPWLAHVASAEGILAADHIAKRPTQAINYQQIPSCIYSSPEVASVGLSEHLAKEKGHQVQTAQFPFSALGKARILGETAGLIKIVTEKRYGEILGVHILGPKATELIGIACAALKLECTVEELSKLILAHPTLSEGLLEVSHAALGYGLHS